MSEYLRCAYCPEHAVTMLPAGLELAYITEVLTGRGMYLDPAEGFLIPVCDTHRPPGLPGVDAP